MSEPDRVMYVRICAFCRGAVERTQLTTLWIPSRLRGGGEFNAHVDCLRHALHPTFLSDVDPDDVLVYPPPPS